MFPKYFWDLMYLFSPLPVLSSDQTLSLSLSLPFSINASSTFGKQLITLQSYTSSTEDNAVTSIHFNTPVLRPNLLTLSQLFYVFFFSLLWISVWFNTLLPLKNLSTTAVSHLYSIAFLFNYMKSSGKWYNERHYTK